MLGKRAIDRQGFLERRHRAAVVASSQRRLTEAGKQPRAHAAPVDGRARRAALPDPAGLDPGYIRPSQISVATSSGTISSTRLNAAIDRAVSPLLLWSARGRATAAHAA